MCDQDATPSDEEEQLVIGPVLPPQFQAKDNDNESESDDQHEDNDDEDDFGPALPPGFQLNGGEDRVIGPALPENFPQSDSDGDDDFVVGPMPQGLNDKNHQYDASKRIHKKSDKKAKREQWMLEPGKAIAKSLVTKSVTKFSQRSSKKDTPLTEEQKLEMEQVAEKESKMRVFLDKYEKKNKRNVSLLDQHRNDMNTKKSKLPEKTERREFDRDKDLNVPRMDNKKKNSFIKEASSTFSTRFSSGKFQKFL